MKDYKSKTGNGLLAICMGKNYQDSMVVYREYVQNACDSIYEAMKLGYYSSDEEKRIAISIQPALKRVCFMDRGTGVPQEQIGPRLVDLGASIKNGIDQIGSNGIGRLVGANWCDKIIFETSYKGEAVKSILSFDSLLAHELIKDKTGDCTESLDLVTLYHSEPEDINEHYFRVTLENAKESLWGDLKAVKDYLSSMVPVDYTFEFEDLIKPYLRENPEYNDFFKKLICCHVTVNEDIIEKPYTKEIYSEGSNIPKRVTPPSFFKVEDSTYGTLAWGWYAFNEKIEQMNSLPYRGIRLRKHNMAIGSYDYLTKFFPKPVDANYFIGEIHIVHPDIHPTGTREAVETSESPAANIFLYKLEKAIFPDLKKAYENLSRLGSAALTPLINAKFALGIDSAIQDNPDFTDEQRQESASKAQEARVGLARSKEELKRKIKAVQASPTISPKVLDFIVTRFDKEIATHVTEINRQANGGMQLQGFKLEPIIQEALQETQPSIDIPETPIVPSNNPIVVARQEETGIEQYKILGKSEYKLMKQVYQILDAEKDLPPQIRERLKKKLLKKLVGK